MSVGLGFQTLRAIVRNSLKVTDSTILVTLMKVNEGVRTSGLKEQRRPDTSSAICDRKAVKISTEEQTISVQLIGKQLL